MDSAKCPRRLKILLNSEQGQRLLDQSFELLSLSRARRIRDLEGAAFLRARTLRLATALPDNAVLAVDGFSADEASTGPLHGIPFAVKDNINCAPFATTGGCPAMRAYRPQRDADVVATLKAAGGYVPIKTNLHELAFGVTSSNAAYGAIRNPFDARRVAGGSSGGNAAAIARGVVPFAIGTDTGGSTRIPAAICGVVGFRPSTGRYSSQGVLMLSTTRDAVGPMAANCADLASIDALITSAEPALPKPGTLRIGVLNPSLGQSVKVDTAIHSALGRLASSGLVDLIPLEAPEFDDLDARFGNTIVFHEAFQVWTRFCERELRTTLADFTAEIASPDVKAIFGELPAVAATRSRDYQAAIDTHLPALRASYTRLFDEHRLDLITTPTISVQAPLIGEDDVMQADAGLLPTFPTLTANTALATLTGAPSLALPAGRDEDGLPVSMLLEARPGRDRDLLAAGCALEETLAG